MVFGRYIPEHLAWWAVFTLLSVGTGPLAISPRCADAAYRLYTVEPGAEAAVDLTGEWTGTYHSNSGGGGTISASFNQNGSSVTGSMTVAETDCFSLLSFAGTVDGNTLTGTFTAGSSRMDITGMVNGSELNGTYTILAGPCAGDTGTFVLATVSPTPTNTPTPTETAAPTPTVVPCVGDCNGDGTVTVDEILAMVNIALGIPLGNVPVGGGDCRAGDANHDGQITVDEILAAVNNALNGCPLLCGNVVCAPGEYCCNALMSTCAPLGDGCVQ
jgi:hypothetical protein